MISKTVTFLSVLLVVWIISSFIPFNFMGLGVFGFFCSVFAEYFGWKKIIAIYLIPQYILILIFPFKIFYLSKGFIPNDFLAVLFSIGLVFVVSIMLVVAMVILHKVLHKLGFFNRINLKNIHND